MKNYETTPSKSRSIIRYILVICGILLLSGADVTFAQSGLASIWEFNSAWGLVGTKGYAGPTTSYLASSTFRNSDGTYHILWTAGNVAVVRKYSAGGAVLSSKGFGGPGTGWTATSIFVYSDGSYSFIWTADNAATMWKLTSAGALSWTKGFSGPGTGWTMQSFFYNSSSDTYDLLWGKGNTGNLWIVSSSWSFVGAKGYGNTITTFTPKSFYRNSDGSYHLLWSGANQAALWTLSASHVFQSQKGFGGPGTGWIATGFEKGPASTAKTDKSAGVLFLKKSGTGAGTISSGTDLCAEVCSEFTIPYVAGEKVDLTVTPEAGSYFAGWVTAAGVPLENIYYANPGDTVYAIFNQQ